MSAALQPIDLYRMGWHARQKLARRLAADAREAQVVAAQVLQESSKAARLAERCDDEYAGTHRGYRRHRRRGDAPCAACRAAHAADRKEARKPSTRVLAACGTRAAYVRHRRKGEPACAECLDALRKRSRDYYYARTHGRAA